MKRTASSAPNDLHAACESSATAQTKMLILFMPVRLGRRKKCSYVYLIHLPTGNFWRARFWGYYIAGSSKITDIYEVKSKRAHLEREIA